MKGVKILIYKIEHFYSIGRNKCKYAIFVESDIEPEQMANIVGAIQLKFETIQDKEDDIDDRHLLHLLTSYFGAKDVKEQYKHVLNQTVLKDKDWKRIVHIPIVDGKNEYVIIQIDLYEARDVLCGPNFEESFKYLPNDRQFNAEIEDLSKFYVL